MFFLTTIGLQCVYGSWNLPKQKKIEKIMQCTIIISLPLLYGSGFFKKKETITTL
jgi:hypothetical protein